MGADMLIESIGFKASDRFVVDVEWATAAFARARTLIAAIDQGRLREINEECGAAYDDVETYRATLLEDLAEVEAAALGSHRQSARIQGGGGVVLVLSGGLSWGDAPTELFNSMSRLHEADVLPDARWPEP